eukprot:TRINITY_DN48346_c0_g1_i1.p1 TRINITY_DN48346_c0_g1~~TRINITY_DN48346_c0_g1_i1.p1  ORF type:complete len:549 (-),score=121.33 TRINITY_DN48346_c0_g1_i1:45-1691(-)
MDISQMSEEEQLQAALQLSMQDVPATVPAATTAPAAEARPQVSRPQPRSFPGKDAQDVLSPPLRCSAKKKRGEPRDAPAGAEFHLEDSETAELLRLLFGDKPDTADVERWLNVGFQWSQRGGTEWGLWQRHGGPCGVFAPVQAFIVRHLLFGGEGGEAPEPATTEQRREQPLAVGGADEEDARASVLAHALASILFHSTQTSSYVVCEVAPKAAEESASAGDGAAAAIAAAVATSSGAGALLIKGHRTTRALDARQLLEEGADGWLAGPRGVLSFLCSVLLTRMACTVREDMDDPSTPLIGRFGHCSQELVNMMLIGEATSNVFDGTRWLGDDPSSGFLVKGVDSDRVGVPHVGFLSEMEPMRYLCVGVLYKHPDFPIWVLGSPTHYTLLFSTRRADSQLSDEARLEQQAKKVFVDNSLDEGGLAMSSNLSKMLEAMGIDSKKLAEAEGEMVREEVILWEDFRRWICKQFAVSAGANEQSNKLQLFLYDGQDPPGPTLKSIKIELSDIDPALAGGGSDGDPFVATLQTRWPNAVVQVEEIKSSGDKVS